MSHDTCYRRDDKIVGHDKDGNEIHEVIRYFKELAPETRRYTVPKQNIEKAEKNAD